MKSYVVRIYRDKKGCSRELLGTAERPGEDVKLAFTSFDELKDILRAQAGKDISPKCWNEKGSVFKARKPCR